MHLRNVLEPSLLEVFGLGSKTLINVIYKNSKLLLAVFQTLFYLLAKSYYH